MPGSQRQPAGPRRGKADRQREWLAVARRVLTREGFRATTLARIAAEAGVGEGALTRDFPDRGALLAGLLAPARVAALERWQAVPVEGADPLTRLRQAILLALDLTEEYPAELGFLQQGVADGADASVLELARGLYQESEVFLARLIAEGQQTGMFRRALDSRAGANTLLRAGLGHLTMRPFLGARGDPAGLDRALDCVLHGLLKTDV